MDGAFRKLAFEKLAAKLGLLSTIVEDALNPKNRKKPNYSTIGSAGPGTAVLISDNAVKPDGTVDIVINLRGLVGTPEGASKTGVEGAVVTAEAVGPQSENMGSKLLTQQFGNPDRIKKIVNSVISQIQEKHPDKKIKRGKLILSGFSGGGAPIARLAAHADELGIDGIIINDGLHTDPKALDPLIEFARRAENGEKLFKVLHTAIQTSGYANTTETAEYIRNKLGLQRQRVSNDSQTGLKPVYTAKKGNAEIIALFDEIMPYYQDNRPGSMGWQHIQAVKAYPELFGDVQEFLNRSV
jgi:hypothetical protein